MSQPSSSARFLCAAASIAAALFATPGIAAAAPPQGAASAAPAAAAAPPLLTREQEQQIEAVRRSLPPAARALVRPAYAALQQRQTAAEADATTDGEATTVPTFADAAQAVRGLPAGKGMAAPAVDSIALLVLANAAQDADRDLREAADDGKRTAAQKARLRALQARMGAAATAGGAAAPTPPSVRRTPTVALPRAAPRARPVLLTASLSEKDVASASLDRRTQMAADIQKDMDALNDLSDQEALRLQIAMDRRAKLLATLSDLLKKTADTQSAITRNLK